MNVNQLFPSKWVKAPDLNGKRIPVTIRQVTIEEVQGDNGKEKVPAVWFKGAAKALLMNKTIAMQIAALHGPETDEWAGKRITLYATKVKAFGKTHDVIRVADTVPPLPQAGAKDKEEEIATETLNDHEDIGGETPDGFDHGNLPEEKEQEAPTVSMASQTQLTKLNSLGRQFYGAEEWKDAGPKAVAWKTGDRTKVAEELTAEEVDALIASLERKIVAAAGKAQSAPKQQELSEEDKALWAKNKPAAPQTEVKPNRRRLPMDRLLAFLATRARGATIEEVSQALGVSYTTTSSKLKLAWQGGRLRRSGMPLRYYAVNTKEPLPDLPQK